MAISHEDRSSQADPPIWPRVSLYLVGGSTAAHTASVLTLSPIRGGKGMKKGQTHGHMDTWTGKICKAKIML